MLEEEIVRLGAFKTGEFTLASGRKSDYYVDLRVAITRPDFLRSIVKAMSQHVEGCDRIAGIELGAVPIAAALSLETDKPFLMVRKGAKEHGTGKLVEGELVNGERVLFVEDTTTTAGSLIRGIEAVRELGGIVEKAVVVVDREEGARENLTEKGVELVSLASIDRLKELSQ